MREEAPVEVIETNSPFDAKTRTLALEFLRTLKQAQRYAERIDAARALANISPAAVPLFLGESKPKELAVSLREIAQRVSLEIFGKAPEGVGTDV